MPLLKRKHEDLQRTTKAPGQTKLSFVQSQGRSQNLKEVPQNFMKVLNVDDVTLSS